MIWGYYIWGPSCPDLTDQDELQLFLGRLWPSLVSAARRVFFAGGWEGNTIMSMDY